MNSTIPLFKIRCSAIWEIMSEPQTKSPKQKYLDMLESIASAKKKYEETKNKETKTAIALRDKIQRREFDELPELESHKDEVHLSATCISHLDSWLKEALYGRRKQLDTEAINKGNECEYEAIHILNKATWKNYKKSEYKDGEKMENERCTGHEDIDDKELFETIDTKVKINIDTFQILDRNVDKKYWRQWQGYLWLKWPEYKKHTVANVLVNTPAWILKSKLFHVQSQIQRKFEDIPGWEEFADREIDKVSKNIFLSCVYDQQLTIFNNWDILQLTEDQVIPHEKRIYLQSFERDDKAIERIKKRVIECRKYLISQWYPQIREEEKISE